MTFDPEAPWSLFDIAAMKLELEDLFGRSVDLVEEKALQEPIPASRHPEFQPAALCSLTSATRPTCGICLKLREKHSASPKACPSLPTRRTGCDSGLSNEPWKSSAKRPATYRSRSARPTPTFMAAHHRQRNVLAHEYRDIRQGMDLARRHRAYPHADRSTRLSTAPVASTHHDQKRELVAQLTREMETPPA